MRQSDETEYSAGIVSVNGTVYVVCCYEKNRV
jgi:hypothetical protein